MTTSRRKTNTAAEPSADQEAPAEGAVPEDEQELRHEIEQTREQLGETVELLAAKADLKGRAKAKVGELTGRMKGITVQMRAKAAERSAGMRSQAAGKTATARRRTAAAGSTAKTRLQARAAPVWEKAPEPVRRTAEKGASFAKQRRAPLMAATATLLGGYLALRWWRKR